MTSQKELIVFYLFFGIRYRIEGIFHVLPNFKLIISQIEALFLYGNKLKYFEF